MLMFEPPVCRRCLRRDWKPATPHMREDDAGNYIYSWVCPCSRLGDLVIFTLYLRGKVPVPTPTA